MKVEFLITFEDIRTGHVFLECFSSLTTYYNAWIDCVKYAIEKTQTFPKYVIIKSIEDMNHRGI